MLSKLCRLALGGAVLLAMTSHAQANLLVNGDFDVPDIDGCYALITEAPPGFGWTVAPSDDEEMGIDLIDGYEPGLSCWDGIGGTVNPDGIDQSVDIDSTSSISQRFTTVPGQSYRVSLFFSRNPSYASEPRQGYLTVIGNTMRLSVILDHDAPNATVGMTWQEFSAEFVADSATTLLSIQGDAYNEAEGIAIDHVSVTANPPAEQATR